jgi:hypothetical protein
MKTDRNVGTKTSPRPQAKSRGGSIDRIQSLKPSPQDSDKKNRRIGSRETTRDCGFGSLSDRHWLFIYMKIVARHTRRAKLRKQIFISLLAMESIVFGCSVEQTDHSVEQRLSLVYRGDPS